MKIRQLATSFFLFSFSMLSFAAGHDITNVQIQLTDNQKNTLSQAVIWAVAKSGQAVPKMEDKTYVMDQKNKIFTPFVLPVHKGGTVTFPNSDSIKHHVYSFSPAKRFELKLYKGIKHEPIVFDTPGVVEMGCNIHDWMLSYIVVVDSPYFSTTDQNGFIDFPLEQGEYDVFIWHPRFENKNQPVKIELNTRETPKLTIQLRQELLPEVEQQKPKYNKAYYERL